MRLALRAALGRGGPLPDALVRYYRPGVNWVGRVLFLVPVLGVALVAMSGGEWGRSDAWVTIGLAAVGGVAVAAEAVLWPAERRLQEGWRTATRRTPVRRRGTERRTRRR